MAVWTVIETQAWVAAAGWLCGYVACGQGERFAAGQGADVVPTPGRRRLLTALRASVATCVAVGFVAVGVGTTTPVQWLLSAFVLFVFAVIASADALCLHLPPAWLVIGVTGIGVARVIRHPLGAESYVLAAIVAGGGLWLLCLLWPHALGQGDAKLMALIGLYLGSLATLLAVALAAWLALAWIGLALLLGHRGQHTAIAFAPFLCVAAVLAHSLGGPLLRVYMTFLGTG
jgi:leader peptidase (prepilin peptidase)/N-methyltransferase